MFIRIKRVEAQYHRHFKYYYYAIYNKYLRFKMFNKNLKSKSILIYKLVYSSQIQTTPNIPKLQIDKWKCVW